MQCAVIDIGSNSIRLSVYDAEKTNFKILFKEKIMAGLASYPFSLVNEMGVFLDKIPFFR